MLTQSRWLGLDQTLIAERIAHATEDLVGQCRRRRGRAVLVRINPELPLSDSAAAAPCTLPLCSCGLEAVRQIDAIMQQREKSGDSGLDVWRTRDPLDGLSLLTEHGDAR